METKIPPLASKQLEAFLTPITDIKPHPDNYKKHPADQIKTLRASLKAFGCTAPIKANLDGFIIAGHGMYELYLEDGYTHIPVVFEALDNKLSKAYLIADNETARKAETDQDQLNELLKSAYDIPNFDIDALGISLEELDNVLDSGLIEVSEDHFNPEAVIESRVIEGDLWQLGKHRLLCGDSTKMEDVERLMNGEKAELLFTSPPYSDMRDYNGDKELDPNHLSSFIKAYHDFVNYQAVNLGLQFKNSEVVQYWNTYIEAAKEAGYKLLAWNVWDKTTAGSVAQATNMFFLTHEWLFVFGDSKKRLNRCVPNNLEEYAKRHGENFLKGAVHNTRLKNGNIERGISKAYTSHQLHSVFQHLSDVSHRLDHPAVFPVGLPAAYIEAMTNQSNIVIDPFCGSGTTLIACEQLNRICYAMELDPHYCDVILQRWEQYTGQKAQKIG